MANDLTAPYKACLVPLILSRKMKTHTESHHCVRSDWMTGGAARKKVWRKYGDRKGKKYDLAEEVIKSSTNDIHIHLVVGKKDV